MKPNTVDSDDVTPDEDGKVVRWADPTFLRVGSLDDFFGDDFFVLIDAHQGDVRGPLRRIQSDLKCVASGCVDEYVRGQAAYHLGLSVCLRADQPQHLSRRNKDRARAWLAMAIRFGSVRAAAKMAQLDLAEHGLLLHLHGERALLPILMSENKDAGEKERISPEDAYVAWYQGVRTALRQVESGFKQWHQADFVDAFTCILCFVTLLPDTGFHYRRETMARERRDALVWVKPLWNELTEVFIRHHDTPELEKYRRHEQLQAALLAISDPSALRPEPESGLRAGSERESALERHCMVVVTSEIPPSADRADNEYLKRFEALRKPIALTPMPDRGGLETICSDLLKEFPWAYEAVQVVMSELRARKRHGVVIQGMAPVLLVGAPGSGKTRFTHRLGELVGTPHTVINMSGMSDEKVLKGVTRGWASNRASRIVEFMLEHRTANPLFILDEIDKAGRYANGGNPHDALLDLLEPGNARRYHDIFLMTECDLSKCFYIATSNSLGKLPAPLLSRFRPVYFPEPLGEHGPVILDGILRDLERSWGLSPRAISLEANQMQLLAGLPPRQMRHAVLAILGDIENKRLFTLH